MKSTARILAVLILSAFALDLDAQCAMCKAVLESGEAYGEAPMAKGINNGILYLMAFPYILMAAVKKSF